MRVKICGLTREADVSCAVEAGADAVGFVSGFPESPRNISLERASQLGAAVPPFVETVLVTTAETLKSDPDGVRDLQPSAIQLYGNGIDLPGFKMRFRSKLIRPAVVSATFGIPEGIGDFDAVLSESSADGRFGGTGRSLDLEDCARARVALGTIPFILSGGLNPDNVAASIARVRPYAVDVSSGVEASPGRKDVGKVRLFVRNAKGAAE